MELILGLILGSILGALTLAIIKADANPCEGCMLKARTGEVSTITTSEDYEKDYHPLGDLPRHEAMRKRHRKPHNKK